MPSDTPRRFAATRTSRGSLRRPGPADDIELWREHGPRVETQELLDVILAEGFDVRSARHRRGGRPVHVTLLEAGAATAWDVERLRVPRRGEAEAERRGLADRSNIGTGRRGAGDELAPADIGRRLGDLLLPASCPVPGCGGATGPRIVGLTYIHDVWWLRFWMRFWNLVWVLRRFPDRWCVHRHRTVDRLMAERDTR